MICLLRIVLDLFYVSLYRPVQNKFIITQLEINTLHVYVNTGGRGELELSGREELVLGEF